MGIDYVIDLDCGPKEALTTEGIVELVKARSRAERVLAVAREHGDTRSPSEITFGLAINRNGTIERTDVAVQSLLDRAAALETHRDACMTCPANRHNPDGYGCYQHIGYPIEADTERFLMSRLPDDLEKPDGHLFLSALRDFAWDGAQSAHMRTQGETFFRLRTPIERSWPQVTVSSDQLFHMLFHVGHLQPTHSMLMCMFFGLLAMGDEDPVRDHAVPVESDNGQQMIDFLNSLAFASQHELDVLIDA